MPSIRKHWKVYLESVWYLLFGQILLWGANWMFDLGMTTDWGWPWWVAYITIFMTGAVYMTRRAVYHQSK